MTALRARSRGFTLIEVLVVLVIIGILAVLVNLSMSGRAVEDRMQEEARRLKKLVELAMDEAQLQGSEMGFQQTTEGYEFLKLGETGRWQSQPSGLLRPRAVEAPFYMELRVEDRLVAPADPAPAGGASDVLEAALSEATGDSNSGTSASADEKKEDEDEKGRVQPQVFLLSSGESTAFTLDVKLKFHPGFYRVECDMLSRCVLTHQDGNA